MRLIRGFIVLVMGALMTACMRNIYYLLCFIIGCDNSCQSGQYYTNSLTQLVNFPRTVFTDRILICLVAGLNPSLIGSFCIIKVFASLGSSLSPLLNSLPRQSFESNSSDVRFMFNSRTAIAGANIGLLLVFYHSKRSIGFIKVFYRKYYSFRRCFDLKAKASKIAV